MLFFVPHASKGEGVTIRQRLRFVRGYILALCTVCLGSNAALSADEEALDLPLSASSNPEQGQSGFWGNLFDLSLPDDLSVSGYLKNETAYRFREPRSITKIRNIINLELNYSLSADINLTAAGWAYYDLAYDLYNYQTIAARAERDDKEPLVFIENLEEEKDSPVSEIRELYVDWFLGDVDLRLGKQYVVWGVLEGNRVTDEINPLDFRELILPDVLDYRIPLWTAKANYYGENATYEFLWIPDIQFHKPGPLGSEWQLLQKVPNTKFPKSFKFENSEYGIKMTREMFDAEVSFSYFYTWDDYQVVFRQLKVDLDPEPKFFPTYTRISMWGTTIVKPLGDYILKGELAYVPDKWFGIQNTTDRDGDGFLDNNGEVQRKHIRWGIGVDFNVAGWEISPAFVQWIIFNYDEAIIQDEADGSISLFVRKEFAESSSIFQLLMIYMVNLDEYYVKPKVTYQLTDSLQMAVGADLFTGRKSQFGVARSDDATVGNIRVVEQRAQFFGNFDDNDRIFMNFKYSF